MENTILTQIQDRFRLDISLLRLQRQIRENEAALRQAKFDLRTAQQELTLYEGSFRSFLDRISGRQEARETSLRHAAQKAEANLASAQRKKEILNAQLPELEKKRASAPDWNSLRQQTDTAALKEWLRLESLFCMEALLPLLEENHTALMELRNMMSGANVGKVYTFAEQAQIGSAPESTGQSCKPYILRLKAALAELDIPFVPCTYFDNPTAFVISAAAVHNRRDRLNKALGQVEAVQKLLPKLMKQLEL